MGPFSFRCIRFYTCFSLLTRFLSIVWLYPDDDEADAEGDDEYENSDGETSGSDTNPDYIDEDTVPDPFAGDDRGSDIFEEFKSDSEVSMHTLSRSNSDRDARLRSN